jgi:hypothetical protein
MDKKEPTEASPSCREVSEIAASSRLDKRPGNKGFDFFFFKDCQWDIILYPFAFGVLKNW